MRLYSIYSYSSKCHRYCFENSCCCCCYCFSYEVNYCSCHSQSQIGYLDSRCLLRLRRLPDHHLRRHERSFHTQSHRCASLLHLHLHLNLPFLLLLLLLRLIVAAAWLLLLLQLLQIECVISCSQVQLVSQRILHYCVQKDFH